MEQLSDNIKAKLSAIYELINRGTDGEKAAAKAALERILKKLNIKEEDLTNLHLRNCSFKYNTKLEIWLICRLLLFYIPEKVHFAIRFTDIKAVEIALPYQEYILIECSYEYFRRHMAKQYRLIVLPQLKKCRKRKTRRVRKSKIDDLFFNRYIIKSGLYKPEELTTKKFTSKQQVEDYVLIRDVDEGKFNRQIATNLLLEDASV